MASLSSESDFVNFEEIEAFSLARFAGANGGVFTERGVYGIDLNSRTIIGSEEFTELRGGSSQDW